MAFDKAKAVRAAEKFLAQSKIPAAIQEYRKIVEYDAQDYSALNTLGDLYARVDQKQEAVECYKLVADHYREQGFTLKAIAMYKKLTRFGFNDYNTAMSLAALYEQQGLMADARAQYLAAADASARAGNTRDALEVLRRIADLDPSNTQIRLRLADGYLQENLHDLAAEAFIEAGERMSARGDYDNGLEAYTKALNLNPGSHPALRGLVAVHTALGSADEAAEVIDDVLKGAPGDLELRAMLVRAHVEAENAIKAEEAAEGLYAFDPTNFTLFFDVAQLYLKQGNIERAVHLLGRASQPALSGRQDKALLELLQEVLARDPEQMTALRLLAQAYEWLRDDDNLRSALERLADAADAAGLPEDERKALAKLVRLSPDEPRYRARLEGLGGPLPGDELPSVSAPRPDPQPTEVPTFESFMKDDDTFTAAGERAPAAELEWNSMTAPADPGASFGDLNADFSGAGHPAAAKHAAPADFQEIDFGASTPGASGAGPGQEAPGSPRAEQMLQQELEGVDFYITQGYADIAHDTLDMLERQYGSHPEIESRRRQLATAGAAGAAAGEAGARAPSDFSGLEFAAEATPAPAGTEEQIDAAFGAVVKDAGAATTPPPAAEPAGIDPGLAAIFDEFREAVEEVEKPQEADYETHYNLGLAYREMGLLDQAIEELQTAIDFTAHGDGTPRYLQCCNMLGHCFSEKGMPRAAVLWFQKGLEAPGHTEDEYQALRYELGTAYEQLGDLDRSIEVFTEVYGIDVSYRGVAGKLRDLQAQKTVNRES